MPTLNRWYRLIPKVSSFSLIFLILCSYVPFPLQAGDLFTQTALRLSVLSEESQAVQKALCDVLKDEAAKASQLEDAKIKLSEVEIELERTRKELETKRALEEEVERLKQELEQTKVSAEQSYERGRAEARLPAIREFLKSPILDALVRLRSGEINQAFYFKGAQHLLSAAKIEGALDDFLPKMNPYKNIFGNDYRASSLPPKLEEFAAHEFAPFLEEFGAPMPNPDELEAQSESEDVDIEGDSRGQSVQGTPSSGSSKSASDAQSHDGEGSSSNKGDSDGSESSSSESEELDRLDHGSGVKES
jgi:Arc/MetJ family transcription regulator